MVSLARNTACCAVVFLTFFLENTVFAFDNNDLQYWNTECVSWKVSDKWKLALEEEFRYADDAKDFYYQHSDLGFSYSGLPKWLEVGAYYRHIFEKDKGKWLVENQPHLDAALKWKIDEWGFNDRSRLE